MLGLRNGPIAKVARRNVLALDNPAVAARTQVLKRTVGRSGVGDQNFIGDCAGRVDARANVGALVLARNQQGQRQWHRTIAWILVTRGPHATELWTSPQV